MRTMVLTVLLLTTSPLFAQKPLHDGFKVELLYQVPDIEHPSVVTCDDEGNLFIGEDPMDMRGPTTKHIDRIIYVRFDKQTGKMTKTVFAEGLSAVFGMIWRDGALYVMHAPLYSVFRDTNGDGVADERKDLATGFGPDAGVYGFNDHIVTGTRLGIDNRVYISVGDKGIPKATGADGSTVTLEGGGVVRMKLDGTQLENFTSGTRNHLDVALDPLDNIFTYDNTDDGLGWWTRFTHHVPTGYYGYPYDYHPHPERHLPRISEHQGGSPVGAACYNEAAWPEKYRGAAFHCEWGKAKVQVFYPKKSGATFEATMEDFLVRDGQEEFRPLDLCFSPDGKYMYLADWNFGGWVNPKVCGRVFRISYVGTDVTPEPPRANNADDIEAQLKSLAHPAQSERIRAQHKLATLGEPAIEPLRKLLRDAKSDKWARIHAIWTQNEMLDRGVKLSPEGEWGRVAVEDQDADVRAQAARAAGLRRAKPALNNLLMALADGDAAVRMHSAVALGRIGDSQAAPALFSSLDDADVFARHVRVQALRAIGDWKAADKYLRHSSQTIRLATILAMTGQYHPDAVASLAQAAKEGADGETRAAALAALAEVHRKADPYTKGWWGTQPARGKPARSKIHAWEGTETVLSTLREALRSDQERLRAIAVKALGEMKDAATVPIALEMVSDEKLEATVRVDALRLLIANEAPQTGEVVAKLLASSNLPEALTLVALNVAEDQKLTAALESIMTRSADPRDAVQAAALGALAAVEPDAASQKVSEAIKTPNVDRQRAAMAVAGRYALKATIPALLGVASTPALEQEATLALTAMPDKRALGLYLQGVASKNSVLRDASRQALVAIAPTMGDEIKERHARNELSTEMRRELQAVFAAPTVIRDWQIIGGWSQDHGEPKFDATKPLDPSQRLTIRDQDVAWKAIKTTNPTGRVSPGKYVSPDGNVWSLAYATIESSVDHQAEFLLGSDDQAVLWINGQRVFQFTGNRGWAAEQDKGQAPLKKGLNHIYLLCGNTGGPWDFSLALRMHNPDYAYLFENVPAALDVSVFREHALKNAGNAERGKQIFADTKGVGCIKCHAVAGEGAKIGPDLLGIGSKYPREELIRSVLEPSNRVAESYRITSVITDAGQVVSGIVQSENEAELELVDATGKVIKLKKDEIEDRKKTSVSLMPNGLKDGMSLADFADVIAYLESLKQAN